MKTLLKRRAVRVSFSLFAVMMMALIGATSAFADGGGNLSPTLNAGSLGVDNNGSATINNTTSLDGTDKALTIGVPLTVTDASGSGAGWHMSVVATQFAMAADSVPFRTIPDNAITFTSTTDSGTGLGCATNSTCSLPTNSKSTGTSVPVQDVSTDGTTITYASATPLAFYNAAVNTGMGIINLQTAFHVSLPASTTYAGTYSSTFIITISANP